MANMLIENPPVMQPLVSPQEKSPRKNLLILNNPVFNQYFTLRQSAGLYALVAACLSTILIVALTQLGRIINNPIAQLLFQIVALMIGMGVFLAITYAYHQRLSKNKHAIMAALQTDNLEFFEAFDRDIVYLLNEKA
jgi:hypothetical protein